MSKWIQKEVDKQLEKIEDNKEENHKKIVEKYFESPTQNKTIKNVENLGSGNCCFFDNGFLGKCYTK